MKPIAPVFELKKYYDPFFFTVFLPEYDNDTIYAHFGRWVELLLEYGITVSGDFTHLLRKQIAEMPRQPYPRLILKLPLLLSNAEKCDFRLEFYGGVLPICSGGFVQAKSLPFNETALERVLDLKLADVVIYPVENDEECLTGPAWALYAHFKDRDWNRRSWAGVIGSPEIGKNVLTAFANKFGQERLAFTYPSEIKQIRKWLEKCDLEMRPEVEVPLTKLLALKDMSVRDWRKTRL
jgi:hypothetical protein